MGDKRINMGNLSIGRDLQQALPAASSAADVVTFGSVGFYCIHGNRVGTCTQCGKNTCIHGHSLGTCTQCGKNPPNTSCYHGFRLSSCTHCKKAKAALDSMQQLQQLPTGVIELQNPPSRSTTTPNPKCPHGKRRTRCRDCGGSGLCEHGVQKDQCAKCRDKYGKNIGTFYCPVTMKAMRDCSHCKGVVTTIKKDERQRQRKRPQIVTLDDLGSVPALPRIIKYNTPFAPDGELDLQSDSDDDFALQEILEPGSASQSRVFVSASASAPGAFSGDHSDSESGGNTFNSDNWWDQGGGKRKRHFTIRLRRNHNTKKKSKIVKRKLTKRSRKNK